jgi:hypothetical protein
MVAIETQHECLESFQADESHEFSHRLSADLPELRRLFGADLGLVAAIRPCMPGSPSSRIVTFESGERVVYRPGNMGLDEAWSDLVGWLNSRSSLRLTAPRVLNRGSYGWAELMRPHPAEDFAAVRDFYRRSGALSAILYLLRAPGCNYDDLNDEVAFGERRPVRVRAHEWDVAAGFCEAYRLLMSLREELLSGDGPPARFRSQLSQPAYDSFLRKIAQLTGLDLARHLALIHDAFRSLNQPGTGPSPHLTNWVEKGRSTKHWRPASSMSLKTQEASANVWRQSS